MKVWASAVVLVAASFLVAAPRVWTQHGGTAAPAAGVAATATPQPLHGMAPSPDPGPTEASDLTHREVVLGEFTCGECHGVARGWLMPEDHATMPENECRDCHRPVPEPSPIALHERMAREEPWEDCGSCHAAFAEEARPAPVTPRLCVKCHATDVEEVLPPSHAVRSDAVSTCAVCHQRQILDIPAVPHRIEGWDDCTFCHGPQRLTPLEGPHNERASEDCLSCHDVLVTPGVYDAMHAQSKETDGCTSCHAMGELAPLPASHDGRDEVLCVLCHQPATEEPPLAPHAFASTGECRSCHNEGHTGALPYDHVARTDELCATCHAEVAVGVPGIPHTMDNRSVCTDCHTRAWGPAFEHRFPD